MSERAALLGRVINSPQWRAVVEDIRGDLRRARNTAQTASEILVAAQDERAFDRIIERLEREVPREHTVREVV